MSPVTSIRFLVAFSATSGEQAQAITTQVETNGDAVVAMPYPQACLDAAHRILSRCSGAVDPGDAELLAGFVVELS